MVYAHGKQLCQESLGSGNKPTNYNSTTFKAGRSYHFRIEELILHVFAFLGGKSGMAFPV